MRLAAGYLGSAWGMPCVEVDGLDVAELWRECDADLREVDDDGVITLWARAQSGHRFAPIRLKPLDCETAA